MLREAWTIEQSIEIFVGLDVSKLKISVPVAHAAEAATMWPARTDSRTETEAAPDEHSEMR
jgi:hypothetical protein